MSDSLHDQFVRDGFAMIPSLLNQEQISSLICALGSLGGSDAVRRRGGVFAVRNLLEESHAVRDLAEAAEVRGIVEPILGSTAFVVRGILFDKTPGANWKVPWHQDQTIAVAERRDTNGFGPWSIKAGVQHVQPPASILENMVSVRIHLDACGSTNGALRVIAGSHALGRISEREAAEMGETGEPTVCEVRAGDALLMRPLLLHASSASETPEHRRVIHLDFTATRLPNGLRWLVEEWFGASDGEGSDNAFQAR